MTDEQIERMKAETMERGIGPLQMVITLVFSAIGGVIVGVIFGLIYAAAYGMLPGKTPIAKGIVIGIIVFIVRLLFAFGIEALISSFMGMNVKISGVYEALNYVSTLVTSLIFGYLLGMFWVRFEPK
ncbi:MAG: hypothetical protein A7316_08245 [Candidatus Altiarchaeales archaeon WOR_SM1_86-2]|nr:MAG: hypothetical protein A7316_08245 [Candidatus Altiarchaeales archaeon WOR_SM1_86-2]